MLKRTGFKRRPTTPLKRTPLRPSSKVSLRRGKKLRVAGHSDVSEQKREIQALLRAIVMKRDGGCLLREERGCGGELGAVGVVLQADHLITRANSATYADSRLVVCCCRKCHFWKSVGSNMRKAQYDDLVKSILPESRVKLWERCEKESWRPSKKGKADWALAIVALKQELAQYL